MQVMSERYRPDYFTDQINKSDAKIAWQYGRIFALAGIARVARLRVLDVGCGAGPGLRYLVAQGADAIGLDHSHYALTRALHLAPGAAAVCSDSAGGLPCADGCADVVLLSELVEHLSDAGTLLCDCARVLTPGGCIVITTPNLWDARRLLLPLMGRMWSGDSDPTHVNLYTPLRLARELRAAGFERVRWYTGIKPAFWLSSQRLRLRMPVGYLPLVGNGLLAHARRGMHPSGSGQERGRP